MTNETAQRVAMEGYTLRGHHISFISKRDNRGTGFEIRNWGEIVLYPLVLLRRGWFYGSTLYYGKSFKNYADNMLKQMHDNPQTPIRIVSGLDSLCKRCPLRRMSCHDKDSPYYEDAKALMTYSLLEGESLTSEDLFKKIENAR